MSGPLTAELGPHLGEPKQPRPTGDRFVGFHEFLDRGTRGSLRTCRRSGGAVSVHPDAGRAQPLAGRTSSYSNAIRSMNHTLPSICTARPKAVIHGSSTINPHAQNGT